MLYTIVSLLLYNCFLFYYNNNITKDENNNNSNINTFIDISFSEGYNLLEVKLSSTMQHIFMYIHFYIKIYY